MVAVGGRSRRYRGFKLRSGCGPWTQMGFWEIFGEDCFCRRPPPFGDFIGLDGPTLPAWRFFGAALPFAWIRERALMAKYGEVPPFGNFNRGNPIGDSQLRHSRLPTIRSSTKILISSMQVWFTPCWNTFGWNILAEWSSFFYQTESDSPQNPISLRIRLPARFHQLEPALTH